VADRLEAVTPESPIGGDQRSERLHLERDVVDARGAARRV